MSTANRSSDGTGEFRYLTTGDNGTTQAITAGRLALTSVPAPKAVDSVVWLGEFRGARLVFFGAGVSDGDTFTVYVWRYTRGLDSIGGMGGACKDVGRTLYGKATCTVGTATGNSSGGPVATAELLVDTITWELATDATTVNGEGTALEAAFGTGTSGAYSPADNTVASLLIPDFADGAGFGLEFVMGGSTKYGNAVVELTR